jgi:hypothetical protein
MKLLNRKIKPADVVPFNDDPIELVQQLATRRATLRARDKTLLVQQLALEADGVQAQPSRPAPDADTLAAQLLDGIAAPATPARSAAAELHSIMVERQAIKQAVNVLIEREMSARRAAAQHLRTTRAPEWAQLSRDRALALVALQQANAACAVFSRSISAVSGSQAGLHLDYSEGLLFGSRINGDIGDRYLKACVASGILTEQEIV